MASQATVAGGIDRHTYFKTRHRGFTFRYLADGSKKYYGYVPGRGRIGLQAAKEREAMADWRDLCGKVSKGEKLPDRNTRFGEMAEAWFDSKTKLTRSTRALYRMALDTVLLPQFGAWKLASIDGDAIAKLIRKLEEKRLASSTIQNYLMPLTGTLDLAVRRGKLSSNPYRTLTNDEKPDKVEKERAYEWNDDQIESLLAASERVARQPEARYDYSPIIHLAVRTGLRLGELLGLQWKYVDLDEGVLHVVQQWTKYGELTPPKSKKSDRRVPLSSEDVAMLRRLKLASKFSKDEDFVFASRTGTSLSHRNVQRRGFEAARDLTGLSPEITFHFLRHAFASLAAHRGVPIHVLSAVLGHRDTGVTQRRYVHLYGREQAEDDFRKAMSG